MVAAALAGIATALAALGPWLLRRASWVDRAPRLGILAWQALSVSAIAAAGLTGLALAASTQQVSGGLAGLFHACAMAIQAAYATPAGPGVAGLAIAVAVFGRALYRLAVGLWSAERLRHRHRAILAVVGRAHRHPDVTLLPDDRAAAYCIAGRPHRIVLTTAADRALDDAQLDAVIAHERAHLRGRHHLAVGAADALARAFPRIPVFELARDEIGRLVEQLADDAATRTSRPLTLAEAVLNLADAAVTTPAARPEALAAADTAAALRVRRLIDGHRPVGRIRATLATGVVAAILLLPAAVFAGPAMSAGEGCCTQHEQAMRLPKTCPAAPVDPRCAAGPHHTRDT